MNNNLLNHHFSVDWGGSRIDFTEVHGLTFSREVVEIRQGASPSLVAQKVPGSPTFQNIVLRRHFRKDDLEMYSWWKSADDPSLSSSTRSVTIKLLNREHTPVMIWRLNDAFPVRVSYSPLVAQRAESIIEEIELCFESMDLQVA